jgi:hypothetical protein
MMSVGKLNEAMTITTRQISDLMIRTRRAMNLCLGYGPSRVRRCRFKGKSYLLIGTKKYGGAIATRRQYENFEDSYAHLFPDGVVRRYGRVIGGRDDIRV